MKTFGNDKILHFAVSAVLVIAAYLYQLRYQCGLRSCCRKRRTAHTSNENNDDFRLLYAAVFSMAIGFIKEILDATNLLPWCDGECAFDAWDWMVDLNGVTAAVLLIVMVRNLCFHPPDAITGGGAGDDGDDVTVASTVVLENGAEHKDDDENDNEQQLDVEEDELWVPNGDNVDDDVESRGSGDEMSPRRSSDIVD